jgi:hypothetical protein
MATAYRKAARSGRVQYPDGSGRVLTDQIVIGDQWEALVALGFVERLEGDVNPSMFEESKPAAALSGVVAYVGPTVDEKLQVVSAEERLLEEGQLLVRPPSVMDMARMAARNSDSEPSTVRAGARAELAKRKYRAEDREVSDGSRTVDVRVGAEEVDS